MGVASGEGANTSTRAAHESGDWPSRLEENINEFAK
jgi:hypothetical protein